MLKFHYWIEEDALDCLATNYSFSSLKTLILNIPPYYAHQPRAKAYFDTANRFLGNLPALFIPEVEGWTHDLPLDSTLDGLTQAINYGRHQISTLHSEISCRFTSTAHSLNI
jgi:hypothetical protein